MPKQILWPHVGGSRNPGIVVYIFPWEELFEQVSCPRFDIVFNLLCHVS